MMINSLWKLVGMSDREVSAVGLHRGAMPVIVIGMGFLLNNL